MQGCAPDAGRARRKPGATPRAVHTDSPVLRKRRHDSSAHNREQIELLVGVHAEVLAHLNDLPGAARRKPDGLLLLHQQLAIEDDTLLVLRCGAGASPPGGPLVVPAAAMCCVLFDLLAAASESHAAKAQRTHAPPSAGRKHAVQRSPLTMLGSLTPPPPLLAPLLGGIARFVLPPGHRELAVDVKSSPRTLARTREGGRGEGRSQDNKRGDARLGA